MLPSMVISRFMHCKVRFYQLIYQRVRFAVCQRIEPLGIQLARQATGGPSRSERSFLSVFSQGVRTSIMSCV